MHTRDLCALVPLMLGACNDPSSGRDPVPLPDPVGTFSASRLQISLGGDQIFDMLALGGHLTLSLTPHHAFTGDLYLPAPWAPFWHDTTAFALQLGGSWTATDSAVTLTGLAQSVLAHITLRRTADSLAGSVLTDSLPDDCCNNIRLHFALTVDSTGPSVRQYPSRTIERLLANERMPPTWRGHTLAPDMGLAYVGGQIRVLRRAPQVMRGR